MAGLPTPDAPGAKGTLGQHKGRGVKTHGGRGRPFYLRKLKRTARSCAHKRQRQKKIKFCFGILPKNGGKPREADRQGSKKRAKGQFLLDPAHRVW